MSIQGFPELDACCSVLNLLEYVSLNRHFQQAELLIVGQYPHNPFNLPGYDLFWNEGKRQLIAVTFGAALGVNLQKREVRRCRDLKIGCLGTINHQGLGEALNVRLVCGQFDGEGSHIYRIRKGVDPLADDRIGHYGHGPTRVRTGFQVDPFGFLSGLGIAVES